jgi:hypothetical protein
MTNPDTASPGRGDSPATTISELTVEADHEACKLQHSPWSVLRIGVSRMGHSCMHHRFDFVENKRPYKVAQMKFYFPGFSSGIARVAIRLKRDFSSCIIVVAFVFMYLYSQRL